ncbi:MAG: endonuclease III [Gammaproteobacteria bacterium]
MNLEKISQISKKNVPEFLNKLLSTFPNPKTELVYASDFELLIAVMLSAQATDISVNKATAILFPKANTPDAILALGEAGLKNYIKTIGLYNSKAKNIIRTCELLIQKHGRQVPATREDLEALPGVGRKTANVVLNTAFGQDLIAVDTHLFRVSNRTGLAPGKNPLEVELSLYRQIPKAYLKQAHHVLILHGRYVCKAKQPLCSTCVVQALCQYRMKNIP